jgi:hypothetical protein
MEWVMLAIIVVVIVGVVLPGPATMPAAERTL